MQQEIISIESMKQILARTTNETKVVILGDLDTNSLSQDNNGIAQIIEQKRNSQKD